MNSNDTGKIIYTAGEGEQITIDMNDYTATTTTTTTVGNVGDIVHINPSGTTTSDYTWNTQGWSNSPSDALIERMFPALKANNYTENLAAYEVEALFSIREEFNGIKFMDFLLDVEISIAKLLT